MTERQGCRLCGLDIPLVLRVRLAEPDRSDRREQFGDDFMHTDDVRAACLDQSDRHLQNGVVAARKQGLEHCRHFHQASECRLYVAPVGPAAHGTRQNHASDAARAEGSADIPEIADTEVHMLEAGPIPVRFVRQRDDERVLTVKTGRLGDVKRQKAAAGDNRQPVRLVWPAERHHRLSPCCPGLETAPDRFPLR